MQPNALISLDDFKAWRRISLTHTADDGIISSYVDEVSDEIQRFCRRVFRQAAIVDEPHHGDGSRTLRLSRPPIVSIQSVRINGATLDPSTYIVPALASDPHAEVDCNETRLVLLAGVFPVGVRNIAVSFVGGFGAIPASVKQACKELVGQRFLQAGRDLSVVVESFGGDGGSIRRGAEGGIPPAIKAKLLPYRLPLAGGLYPGAYERTRTAAW